MITVKEQRKYGKIMQTKIIEKTICLALTLSVGLYYFAL